MLPGGLGSPAVRARPSSKGPFQPGRSARRKIVERLSPACLDVNGDAER